MSYDGRKYGRFITAILRHIDPNGGVLVETLLSSNYLNLGFKKKLILPVFLVSCSVCVPGRTTDDNSTCIKL